MRRNRLLGPTSLGMALALFGCEQARTEAVAPPGASVSKQSSPSPSVAEERSRPRSWRKERFISVTEAVERLQPHVDVPVVLPTDRMAGLPNLKGWLADPKYLYWETADEVRSGTLTLRKGRQIRILSYGRAVFDGCGGRDFAIETNVLGRSALLSQAREHVGSQVLWPVTETGSTGRFGITGTFEGWAMVRLAESMELARIAAMDFSKSC